MKKSSASSQRWNRRDFLKSAAFAAGAAAFGVPTLLRGQNLNSKLNIAIIGAGGKGVSDAACCESENIYALCDVDVNYSAGQRTKYPDAKFYQDYRKLLDEAGKNLDAVSVSTPDHLHAMVASRAMKMGKAVYCQKPLTQTIYEARYLRNLANETGVVTQMGNQGSSHDGLRRAVECIQAGVIGPVRQVHVWTNRPIWPQGMVRPDGSDPVPDSLNWDIWLGPAPERPFKKGAYNPFVWRGWQDFGTGALGDMACHTVNMPFRSLGFGYPTEIEAQTFGVMNNESFPIGSKIRFEFPARKFTVPAVNPSPAPKEDTVDQVATTFWWYDGGQPKAGARGGHDGSNKPPQDLTTDCEALLGEVPGSGCLLIGDKGTIFSPDDYAEEFFIKLKDDAKFIHYKKHPAIASIPQSIPRNENKGDADHRHHLEWINAIKEHKPENCYSRLDITAKLTEIMLLGCVSIRSGKKLEWDGPAMRATNAPEAAQYVKRENRAGWMLS
jgi:hypothetical protein